MSRFFLKKYAEKPRNHRNTGVHLALVFFPKNWQGYFLQIACLLRELSYAFLQSLDRTPSTFQKFLPHFQVSLLT